MHRDTKGRTRGLRPRLSPDRIASRSRPRLTALVPGHGPTVQHSLRATVLRPAGDVVAHRDRPFLAVGDGPHPGSADAVRGQIRLHRGSTARTERNVVLPRAALVGMAFDRYRVLRILIEPNGLLAQDILPFAGQGRAVDLEMNDIADIRGKILSRAGLR